MDLNKPEEFFRMVRLLLDFHSLCKEEKETILLMIDGYRFRAKVREQP